MKGTSAGGSLCLLALGLMFSACGGSKARPDSSTATDSDDGRRQSESGSESAQAPDVAVDVLSTPDRGRDAAVFADAFDPAAASDGDVRLPDEEDAPQGRDRPSDTWDAAVTTDLGIPDCPSLSCDDHNPCTVDSQGPGCACVHVPVADGTVCDDSDACTYHDQCSAGSCKGSAHGASSASVLGTVRSFGSGPSLETVVAFPSQSRAVFLTDDLLTLVEIRDDQMQVLDRVQWGSHAAGYQVSPTVWVLRPKTFIVPLSAQRIAVIGATWSIDLYDIGQDKLQASYRYGFGSSSPDMVHAAVAQGTNLWTCVSNWLQRYEIDDQAGMLKQDPGFTIPAGHNCYGLALAADGALLAATSQGLDVVDISSNDGEGVVQRTLLAGDFLLDVSANAQAVAAYKLDEITSGAGSVVLLKADDYSPITPLPGADSRTPVGFAMASGQLLLEERDDTSCRSVEADLYSLAGSPTLTASFNAMSACRGHFGSRPAVLASAGQLVDLPPAHQVVRIVEGSGKLAPVHGLSQGSFAHVLPAGPHLVEVHGPSSMHLVDISQPENPVVVDGGLLVPMNADWLRFEISSQGWATALTLPDGELTRAGGRASLYWKREGVLPTVAGSLSNAETEAEWTAAGHYLFSISPVGNTDFHLRRIATGSIGQAENQTPVPDVDQTLTTAVPAGLDQRQAELVAADAASGDVLLAEVRQGSSTVASVLSWYAQDGSAAYQSVFSRPPDTGAIVDLGVLGRRAILVFGDHALLVDKSGNTVASYTHPTGNLQRLLAFDETYLYLAGTSQDALLHLSDNVFVFNAGDLTVAGQYTLPEPALSTAVVGDQRVFGMASTLAVASPLCP